MTEYRCYNCGSLFEAAVGQCAAECPDCTASYPFLEVVA